MHETRDLLVEIGTEELPPAALHRLSQSFSEGFGDQLQNHRLAYSKIEAYATPRRLALLVRELATDQPDEEVIRRGPGLKAAFDAQGRATKAAVGFARSCGVSVEKLDKEVTEKGIWLAFRSVQRGRRTVDLIVDMASKALEALPIPKRMRWGEGSEEFVRPVHWVAIVFGTESVSGRLFGVYSRGATRGHRFHRPTDIAISAASEYPEVLRARGMVEPSFKIRRELIREQVEKLAREAGGQAIMDDELLDEVTALCEWPCAILGAFDDGFLEVPSEVLIETMENNQKYFPVVSSNGELLPRFITISNIRSRDLSQVRAGNERVIRPRFADAAFFWKQDLKHRLEDLAPKLDQVVFQETLGTLGEKSARVGRISRHIAKLLGMEEELAARAAFLAKCDLLSQMVFEFPTLQGIMGRYYAEKDREDPCVVSAMEEQYLPRHAGDVLPRSPCGQILSLADKLDSLVGIFAIGQRPTGVKDPYALRRATIGVLRILIETPLPLDLKELLKLAAEELKGKVDARVAAMEVFDYSIERLKGYYQSRNIGGDVVDSVLAGGSSVPSDIHRRALAVEGFRVLPEANALTAANKRIANILRKNREAIPSKIDVSTLHEDAEKHLEKRVKSLETEVSPLMAARDYENVLKLLSGLRDDVDLFFDKVMVMVEDERLRLNRLALLKAIQSLFLQIADISLLK